MSSNPLFLAYPVASDGVNILHERMFRGRRDAYFIEFPDGKVKDWRDYNARSPRPKRSPLGKNWRWSK